MSGNKTWFTFVPGEQCLRCGKEDEVDGDRFQFAMQDDAGSSGVIDFGNLCPTCFNEVRDFANGVESS